MNTNTVTAADLAGSGSNNLTTTPLPSGGSVTTVSGAYDSPIEAASIDSGGVARSLYFMISLGMSMRRLRRLRRLMLRMRKLKRSVLLRRSVFARKRSCV